MTTNLFLKHLRVELIKLKPSLKSLVLATILFMPILFIIGGLELNISNIVVTLDSNQIKYQNIGFLLFLYPATAIFTAWFLPVFGYFTLNLIIYRDTSKHFNYNQILPFHRPSLQTLIKNILALIIFSVFTGLAFLSISQGALSHMEQVKQLDGVERLGEPVILWSQFWQTIFLTLGILPFLTLSLSFFLELFSFLRLKSFFGIIILMYPLIHFALAVPPNWIQTDILMYLLGNRLVYEISNQRFVFGVLYFGAISAAYLVISFYKAPLYKYALRRSKNNSGIWKFLVKV